MSISLDEVRHVARLARLELDDAEVLALQGELNSLIGHFSDIQDVDVSSVEPQSHANVMLNVLAEDDPGLTLARHDALRNAPVTRAGLFVVPNILEG